MRKIEPCAGQQSLFMILAILESSSSVAEQHCSQYLWDCCCFAAPHEVACLQMHMADKIALTSQVSVTHDQA